MSWQFHRNLEKTRGLQAARNEKVVRLNKESFKGQIIQLFEKGATPDDISLEQIAQLLGINIGILDQYKQDPKKLSEKKGIIKNKIAAKLRPWFLTDSRTDILKTLYERWQSGPEQMPKPVYGRVISGNYRQKK